MLLSASPFESHQDLLSRGFAFHSFVDEMSLPLDFTGKQLAQQDTVQAISTPPPPPAATPVAKEVSSGSNKRKRSAPAAEARPTSRMTAALPHSSSAGTTTTLAEPASPESDKKRNKLGYHRTSVACSHCRRRKIRCMVPDNDSTGRCANCVRLKKDCTFCPVDDSTQSRRPQTSSGVSAPGILPSPEPLAKSAVSHSISPSMSGSQVREMMPATADNGLGIYGALPQSGDPSRWYSQIAGWSDKSQSNIFAATPLSAKSSQVPSTSYGMPSPYSMPSASTSLYGRPGSSMTPLSEDARSTTSFHGDFGWTQPVQPAGRSMSFMENYATHPGYAGAQNLMQPRRAVTLPSSTMVYPDPTMSTLSMGAASTMAPTTGAQNMQWNTAMWDQTQQTKDIYGQDAFAFDGQGQWYPGASNAPPF